jgi:hypothetical protein
LILPSVFTKPTKSLTSPQKYPLTQSEYFVAILVKSKEFAYKNMRKYAIMNKKSGVLNNLS